jgi:3-oxoacyl-[acyl-carrier protein] reductase
MQTLQDKVALVTGGSRGIGAAIARKLAAEGADVSLTFVGNSDLAARIIQSVEASGRRGLALRADNTHAVEVEAAVATTAKHFGRLDILVNSAGIFRVASLEELTLDDFDATMAINVRAAFIAAKAAMPLMSEGGRIISIGSNLAVRAPGQGLCAYTASKAALAGLTQALARDLGPRGITANIVHPGSTDTDMNPGNGPAADTQRALMATTAGFADPSQIADVVAFLASPAAGSITGAAWTIDNGANA